MTRTPRGRSKQGVRQAARWIGHAFILDGDWQRGSRAVWRPPPNKDKDGAGGGGGVCCAKARVVQMVYDAEFYDDVPLHLTAASLRGEGIVPRLATYRVDDETLMVVEEDVADLTLAELLRALSPEGESGGGRPPPGLALNVARQIAVALRSAGDAALALEPSQIDVGWDGRLWLRPDVRLDDELDDIAEENAVERALYSTGHPLATVAMIAWQIVAGHHPYDAPHHDDDEEGGDDDDDDGDGDEELDAYERAVDVRERMDEPPPALAEAAPGTPRPICALLDRMLKSVDRPPIKVADELVAALDALLVDEPYAAKDLAGLLRALFPDRIAAAAEERDDRLRVLPGPNVELVEYPLFSEDNAREDDWETADLDDVRRGRDGEERYEPAVEPVDPFEDE